MKRYAHKASGVAGLILFCWCSLWAGSVLADEVLLEYEGIELRADLMLAPDKTLQAGVVLLLHGTLAHNRMEIISTTAELLHDEGYNTLAINLSFALDKRPEGMLDCQVEHRHQHEDASGELTAWLDWLHTQGVSKVALWGHSRGANQIAWFAHEHSHALLDKLILVAPSTWDGPSNAANYQQRYAQPLAPLLTQAEALIAAGKPDEMMAVPGFVYCQNTKVSAQAFVSYGRDDKRKNTPTLLQTLTPPVLVVIGSADEVVADLPAQMAALTRDTIRVETVEGADHFFLDLYADDMVEQIVDFLDW